MRNELIYKYSRILIDIWSVYKKCYLPSLDPVALSSLALTEFRTVFSKFNNLITNCHYYVIYIYIVITISVREKYKVPNYENSLTADYNLCILK